MWSLLAACFALWLAVLCWAGLGCAGAGAVAEAGAEARLAGWLTAWMDERLAELLELLLLPLLLLHSEIDYYYY